MALLISKQSQQQHQQEDDIVSFTEEIFDPPVSVYKGYSLPEDTEEYSCGLTNAIYTIAAADLKDDIFGKLMHCPFQDPGSLQGQHLSSGENASDSSVIELEKVKMEMKMMEAALQGAARQAQAKADEIAKFMNENEQLKSAIEDLKRKSNDAEVESLREEYHQRVATLERKVYALTKERDTLRREQNKKSDAAALLKEKDEIINQVMAEGLFLSLSVSVSLEKLNIAFKKQAAQEGQIRKLRAQIREFEEEKKGLITKLQSIS
ncbi:golgin candidate 5 [Prunus dulcis]|uniref:Golgin candidate 5 n=1 Tax=Prunus dulcis TaxID=3755 RepID=A0A5H2XUJ5_PRUDU|nr:golgin candidate 5 [Prunus dulcis]